VSATRPPARFSEPDRHSGDLDELEELGDDAIIAQQTAAHTLRPRANVAEESRSVVITERRDTEPPRNSPPKSSAEATVVIRDRRALDEMRMQITKRKQQKQALGHRALYLWGALGLAAFLLGGLVAFLATESHSVTPTADNRATNGRSEAQAAQPAAPALSPPNRFASPASDKANPSARAVRLDDLPVEPPRKH